MRRLLGFAATLATLAAPAAATTLFGCEGLSDNHVFSSVEGRDGVFYRLDPDLKNTHPMAPETVEDIARLSRALAEKGTALIYAPIPTKSLAMPRFLPVAASDFGFDASLATTVYLDTIRRLRAAGVRVIDARAEMVGHDGPPPYFRTDPRLTAEGARITARAIGRALAEVPGIRALARNTFETRSTGEAEVLSHARLVRQRHCAETLPAAVTQTYETDRTYTAEGAQGIIALVGSEHSDTPEANFAGFLAEETGLDVIQYSVPGGGAFAAISTYLTSAEFQRSRPSIVVWEHPLAEAPGLHDDQPMQELIAAARDACPVTLAVSRDTDTPRVLTADLSPLDPEVSYMLFVDGDGAGARHAAFTYENSAGETRTREVLRHPGQVPTGRFYVPMTGLWSGGAARVTVALDADAGADSEVRACPR